MPLSNHDIRVNALEIQFTKLQADLANHLLACERRGRTLEKLAWTIVAMVGSVLGLLLKSVLHLTI
ncbi:MAG TPA: hypothetical protein VJQ25_10955 [Nitrospira sp.]|nr:hypothetical protein [Nitrospira sp.]